MRHLLTLLLTLPATAVAQDIIAVGWAGSVYSIDSFTGAATNLGFGSFGQNALAVDASGTIWSTQRTQATPYVYDITTIDPLTGAATVRFPGADIRGLAAAGGPLLYAELDTPDRLAVIDTTSGAITTIGNIGFSGVQAIAMHRGVLYGWDIGRGLLTIDTTTGAGTVVNASAGTSGAGIQFLSSRADGKLIGGQNNIYEIDVATGVATLIGLAGNFDLRGGGQFFGWSHGFGQGCAGAGGIVALTVTGTPAPGGMITTTSTNHAPGLGALLLGFSNTSYSSLPLPLLLDPLVGTSGCSLLVSIDYSGLGVIATTDLVMPLAVPATISNLTFFVQHAAFESVPGGLSMSNGAAVHIGF